MSKLILEFRSLVRLHTLHPYVKFVCTHIFSDIYILKDKIILPFLTPETKNIFRLLYNLVHLARHSLQKHPPDQGSLDCFRLCAWPPPLHRWHSQSVPLKHDCFLIERHLFLKWLIKVGSPIKWRRQTPSQQIDKMFSWQMIPVLLGIRKLWLTQWSSGISNRDNNQDNCKWLFYCFV